MKDGVLNRRRVCENGHRFSTVELHAATAKEGRNRALTKVSERIERRSEKYRRNMQIIERVEAGTLYKVVALDLGISESTVCWVVAKYAPHLLRKSPARKPK